ncbi:MAG: hypothetical protein LBC61_07530 [Candidatus Peribacteria bacterium]|jgi:hypothetical protein|nr:hypothetical protein [Candidatus Peribacteria bacterium]
MSSVGVFQRLAITRSCNSQASLFQMSTSICVISFEMFSLDFLLSLTSVSTSLFLTLSTCPELKFIDTSENIDFSKFPLLSHLIVEKIFQFILIELLLTFA